MIILGEGSLDELSVMVKICIWIVPIIFAVTLHEAAHGYVAYKLGDDTAFRAGRITLNPIKHIDPLGTILLPLIMMLTTNFIFGWAKPVPVNPNKLKNPKKDTAWVAFAGPLSNFLMAVFWVGFLKIGVILVKNHYPWAVYLVYVGQAGMIINLVLMVLNLIPIPPLDGSRVVASLLPTPWDKKYDQLSPFGFFILIALLVSGILNKILFPPIFWLQDVLLNLYSLT